ncbi:MAG: histidine kinase [Zetaproteobacteria bacterium CG_4_9_14_3_um_filter_49_83]|nr:MAG: hypothetical protein AUJ56_08420 [Zetaproteobacteria bacterium CG1_02_49_23]PIQ34051.1 MAG: histidine kinase [Zetaproteobacteria bacterium CG17_big_fil_post_rev_8_21_14_2_50_50_13]PIV29090.1 MAG: histidine kinase [Zetaproteobacteria bacterium CG02_land_8_20_14_3_00_50_9]PIY55901.1 MAG: histidine kinase [Zetaproteobacteria bacterium CG_4_10_14_0_8_um_filter_49_80]PJA35031.1 MAG: histidine kinase [Zetaproteobacteria bacterium CG_4_9_14_3_um_filter_49_83]
MSEYHYFPDMKQHSPQQLVRGWKANWPNCGVLALVAEADLAAIADLQKICSASDVPLVGAVFPELIVDSTFTKNGTLFIRMNPMPEYLIMHGISHGKDRELELIEHVAALGDTLEEGLDATKGALMIIFDALIPNISSILNALYLKLGSRVAYSGANAGSESFKPMDCLFDDANTYRDGVLALALKEHAGGLLRHGYSSSESTYMATSTEGNCIHSVNWEAAFESYCLLAKNEYGLEINAENFYEKAVHFPFGIAKGNGQTLVRIPVGLNEAGDIYCIGEIPENSILTLLKAPAEQLMSSAKNLAQTVSFRLGGSELCFYCAGRRLHLGLEQASRELNEVHHFLGDITGALSLGEIGCTSHGSYPEFHNGAVLFVQWPEQKEGDDLS